MILLTNIGKIPTYFESTLKQLRLFNPKEKIVFIGDDKNEYLIKKYNLEYYFIDINNNDKYKKLKKYDKKNNVFYSHPSKDFWIFTYARFYLIEEYLSSLNTDVNFFFFENDILIYENLEKINNILETLKGEVFFTILDEKRITTGLSYFKNKKCFITLINDMDKILFDGNGIRDIRKNYSKCCPSEMTILRKIKKEKDYIVDFTTLPFSKDIEKFNMVFDPAPYGQYFGGDNKGRSFKNGGDNILKTYVGKEIINEKIKVGFENNKNGLKKPFCYFNNKKIPICNLHIHSKELQKFLSI
jgi:hypothetical protein